MEELPLEEMYMEDWRTLNTVLEHSGYELKYVLGCWITKGMLELFAEFP